MRCSKPSCTGNHVRCNGEIAGVRQHKLAQFLAYRRQPGGSHLVQVQQQMGRAGAGLAPGIEDPRPAQAIDPRTIGIKRRVVNVPGEDEVGLILVDPARQKFVPGELLARPAHRRTVGWGVVDPDPSLFRPSGIPGEQGLKFTPRNGTVPPRADRDHRAVHLDTVAVDKHPKGFRIANPLGDRFVGNIATVPIVVARTDD